MRYFIQLIIPAVIFVGVVYLLTRQRGQRRAEDNADASAGSDTGAFLLILALGAAVAIGTAFALQSFWE
jgi:hypothetical protein